MKSICELNKKGSESNLAKIVDAVHDPKYICRKCSRVANKKGRLCKPADLGSLTGQQK